MTDLEAADGTVESSADPAKPVSRDRARRRRGGGGAGSGGGRGETPEVAGPAPTPRRRTRMWLWTLLSLVFVGALVVMAWQGYETSLDIRGGTASNNVTNPAKPGYEAQVNPTPTHLLVNVTSDGKVADLEMVVDGANGKGGGLLFIPGLIVVQVDGKPYNLSELASSKGLPALVDAVQRALGIAISDATEVSADQLGQLVTPAGPLTISNPADLTKKSGGAVTTVYPAGKLTLQPKDVAAFVDFMSDGASVVDRPSRAELVWEAWLAQIKAGGSAAEPKVAPLPAIGGGDAVDVSSLLVGLSTGTVDYEQLPVERLPVPNMGGFAIYQPQENAIPGLMSQMVPFPGSAFPGQRVRVRLLNGTTDPNAALRAATPIVAAGAQILVLGNASSFDVATTRVEYDSDQQIAAAKAIAAKLGAPAPIPGDDSDAIDVTVTIGKDFSG